MDDDLRKLLLPDAHKCSECGQEHTTLFNALICARADLALRHEQEEENRKKAEKEAAERAKKEKDVEILSKMLEDTLK